MIYDDSCVTEIYRKQLKVTKFFEKSLRTSSFFKILLVESNFCHKEPPEVSTAL